MRGDFDKQPMDIKILRINFELANCKKIDSKNTKCNKM